jgi:hypothetical protein
VLGDAQIDIGDSIQDLTKKSVYNAQGTVIETKKAEKDDDKSKIYSTMVIPMARAPISITTPRSR